MKKLLTLILEILFNCNPVGYRSTNWRPWMENMSRVLIVLIVLFIAGCGTGPAIPPPVYMVPIDPSQVLLGIRDVVYGEGIALARDNMMMLAWLQGKEYAFVVIDIYKREPVTNWAAISGRGQSVSIMSFSDLYNHLISRGWRVPRSMPQALVEAVENPVTVGWLSALAARIPVFVLPVGIFSFSLEHVVPEEITQ